MSEIEQDDAPARKKITDFIEKHGPMTTVEMQARGLKDVNALSAYVANLAKRGILENLGGHRGATIYGIAGQTPSVSQFSLNERGQLRIGNGVNAQVLGRPQIKQLLIFITSTEDVWAPETPE